MGDASGWESGGHITGYVHDAAVIDEGGLALERGGGEQDEKKTVHGDRGSSVGTLYIVGCVDRKTERRGVLTNPEMGEEV